MPFTPVQYPLSEEILNQRTGYIWNNVNAVSKYPSLHSIKNGEKSIPDKETTKEKLPEKSTTNGLFVREENTTVCEIRGKTTPVINTVKAKWAVPPRKLFKETSEVCDVFLIFLLKKLLYSCHKLENGW